MESSSTATNSVKRFLTIQEIQEKSEQLAAQIARAKDKNITFAIALWRGGAYPGMVIQEILQRVQGTKIDHVAIRTESREVGTGKEKEIIIHAVGHAYAKLQASDMLLIVDDVGDSCKTMRAFLAHLKQNLGDRMPQVKIATLFYKPERNVTDIVPDYYVEETDDWLVFPHEVAELTDEEIKEHRQAVWALMQEMKKAEK